MKEWNEFSFYAYYTRNHKKTKRAGKKNYCHLMKNIFISEKNLRDNVAKGYKKLQHCMKTREKRTAIS